MKYSLIDFLFDISFLVKVYVVAAITYICFIK